MTLGNLVDGILSAPLRADSEGCEDYVFRILHLLLWRDRDRLRKKKAGDNPPP